MAKSVLQALLLVFNAYNLVTALYKYNMALHDEEILVACNKPNVHFIDRYVDMSDLKSVFLEDGSVHVHGTATWTKDLGIDNVGKDSLSIQTYKKNRGAWSPTIYNIKREDVCAFVLNPADIFYRYIETISKEQCPFFVGQKFTYNVTAQMDLFVPDSNASGEYMNEIMIHFKSINEYLCANIFYEIYRV